jgi:peptidoglycan/xylan/chitin deacetylase (PgdA/CDA1 family)
MSGAKRKLKSALMHTLHLTGLLSLLARKALGDKAVVLTYHRVLPRDLQKNSFSAPSIVVTPATFEKHVRFISRFFKPLSAQEFAAALRGERPLPKRACLVTFDDGWYDNLEFALPILKRHGVPALLFVATGYIGSERCFWQERLGRLLYRAWGLPAQAESVFASLRAPHIPKLDEPRAREAIRALISDMKDGEVGKALALIRSLEERLGASEGTASLGEDRFLSWQELQTLRASGVFEIESHAVSHVPLTKVKADAVTGELNESREEISRRLDHRPTLLAYPNGDCDEAVANLVRSAGYELAFTTERGYVGPTSNRFQLKRMNIHEGAAPDAPSLLGRIAGLI